MKYLTNALIVPLEQILINSDKIISALKRENNIHDSIHWELVLQKME